MQNAQCVPGQARVGAGVDAYYITLASGKKARSAFLIKARLSKEAFIGTGAVSGQETSGRFTAWVDAVDGAVTFNLPADISAGNVAPWGEDAYVRIRSAGEGAYSTFDLVGRPFTLIDGQNLHSTIIWKRGLQAPVTMIKLHFP